jgi:hypothetical protein
MGYRSTYARYAKTAAKNRFGGGMLSTTWRPREGLKIFFNGPDIPFVGRLTDHDDHFHVELRG